MSNPSADLRLVDTWAASQVSPRTRTAYRQQGARLLDRLADLSAAVDRAIAQGSAA